MQKSKLKTGLLVMWCCVGCPGLECIARMNWFLYIYLGFDGFSDVSYGIYAYIYVGEM